MRTNDDQPLLQAPELVFQVLHYHRSSLDPDSSIIVYHIGIYHTFALAQAAALVELKRTLKGYLHIGYHGRYCDEINCNRRGLITVYKKSTPDGIMLMREIPMSEFRLETLNMGDNATHLAGEESRIEDSSSGIITNMQGTGTAVKVVRLPAKPEQHKEPGTPKYIAKRGEHIIMPEPAPSSPQFPPPGAQYDEERQPDWSRTRIPLFDRRDDGPFRRPGQTPYTQVMGFSTAASTSSSRSVPLDSKYSMQDKVATS